MELFVGGGLLQKVVPAELVVVLGEGLIERAYLFSHILNALRPAPNEVPEVTFIILEIEFPL